MPKKHWPVAEVEGAPVEVVSTEVVSTEKGSAVVHIQDAFVERNVTWTEEETKYTGKVVNQKTILEVQLTDGRVIGVNAKQVEIC